MKWKQSLCLCFLFLPMRMIVSGTVCLLFQMTFIFCVLSFSLTWAPYVLCYISARKRRCSFWTFLLFIVLEIWFKLASVYCCSVKYKQTLYLFVREENNLGLNDTCTCLDSQITSCCTALEYYNNFLSLKNSSYGRGSTIHKKSNWILLYSSL